MSSIAAPMKIRTIHMNAIEINLFVDKSFVWGEVDIKIRLQLFTDFKAARIIEIYRHYYLSHSKQYLFYYLLYLVTEIDVGSYEVVFLNY